MIQYVVKTVRQFESEEQFEQWFERHSLDCLRAGFTRDELKKVREPGGLVITDGELGVKHTETISEYFSE